MNFTLSDNFWDLNFDDPTFVDLISYLTFDDSSLPDRINVFDESDDNVIDSFLVQTSQVTFEPKQFMTNDDIVEVHRFNEQYRVVTKRHVDM